MEKKSILDLERLSTEQYKEIDKLSFVVVLDNIRSLNNIGSVFRTSDAFLVEKIYLCGITATPPHPDIHKTALGAENSVEWVYFNNTIDAVEKLQSDGYIVYGIEQVKDSFSLQNMVLKSNEKYALVLGNEVKGVQQEVVDKCNGCIEIPQFGTKHSLNV